MQCREYVLLGFESEIVRIYIEYLKTKKIDPRPEDEELQSTN